jgi:hypothetical protein
MGRYIAGGAGALLTRVVYRKKSGEKNFIVADAGMNDLLRPSLYDAHHEVRSVNEDGSSIANADLVGPVCESGDYLARDRELPDAREGDLLAIMCAGAYGFSMASNYNSRPRPAEVLVRGERWAVVRVLVASYARRFVRIGERPGLRRARTASTERAFAAELSRITTERRATSTFTVRSSGAPKPVPSLTPPWESMMTRLKPTLPKAARFVRRPRIRAIPSASSPARMSCAKSSALGTTVPCMNARKNGGACETKPPASKLVANCCGN